MLMRLNDFESIERLFDRLDEMLKLVFSPYEIREYREFVDAGEYGLALETIVGIVVEEGKKIPLEALAVIEQISLDMQVMGVVERLRPFAATDSPKRSGT
jgi:hypothetical protein